jgi:Putative lactococcus lactis phage r1t holin
MFTRQFWMLTAERAVKTFAQALAAVLVASGAGLLSADWKAALSTAGMATVVSVLTSVASSRFGPNDSPSVVDGDPPTAPAPSPIPSVQPAPAPAPAA